jgi:hypothetical protein
MELVSGGKPANWSAAGQVPIQFTSEGPAAHASTNERFARITALGSSGLVWMASELVPVTGGNLVFANAYIRGNSITDVRLVITEYNASQQQVRYTLGPVFAPSDESWNNYQSRVGGWHIQAGKDTAYVIVTIRANVTHNPAHLDVDTVSVW